MRTDPRTGPRLFAVGLLAAVALSPALAEAVHDRERAVPEPRPAEDRPVELGLSRQTVIVEPRVGGVATSVYLSCTDGTSIHRELEGVGTALVDLAREDGAPIADGRCKYEIYVHPPVDQDAMRAAEESGDWATVERLSRIEGEQTVIVHGIFRIEGGNAVAVDGPRASR